MPALPALETELNATTAAVEREGRSGGPDGRGAEVAPLRGGATDAGGPLPERPALAPGVVLVGPMESGFRDRQWLLERDGVFVQLPELLYRVAEHADGRRTAEELAGAVSAATGRDLSVALVRLILRNKLIPWGIVSGPAGTGAPRSGRSLLAVRLRLRALDPRRIEPLTRVLQYVYAPPLLIPLLLVVAASRGWLYIAYGATTNLREVSVTLFATPGMLPLVLGLTTAAAAIHELGHASALHYGGGRARAIGAGFYLFYPVFYTDITDAYRLGRWARVRADLGGIYFHLLFSLGLLALYGLTEQPVFVLATLMIDAEILRQGLPFVRFDGYWALADLLGVPDFFTLMGRFLRTVLPLPRWHGPRLPRLKPWVAAAFGAYVLFTLPALAYFLFFFLTSLPQFVTALWEGLLRQRDAFLAARLAGDGLGLLGAGTQAVLLGLTAAGLLLLLFGLARGLARGLLRLARRRRASRPAAPRG